MKKLFLAGTALSLFAVGLTMNSNSSSLIANEAYAAGCCMEQERSLCIDDDNDRWDDHYWKADGGGGIGIQ